ncbi:MAG: Crp/Fnr family transcriptional regulator [Phenylobacterium sp.]|uniref:Crp/Fnr family transcriptional regulator n=1 Tax=Phenylobacterium sp. TaxID=1871053 RepID=UPI00391B6CC3
MMTNDPKAARRNSGSIESGSIDSGDGRRSGDPGPELGGGLGRKATPKVSELAYLSRFDVEDRVAVGELLGPPRSTRAGNDLVGEDAASSDCTVLMEGQAYRHKTLADGRRQILLFHFPGDILNFQEVLLGRDCTVTSLTACVTASLTLGQLQTLLGERPRLGLALWRESLAEAALLRERLLAMGQLSAYERMAHLLCEVFGRSSAAGLVRNHRCYFPATQAHLADALGLSGVHTNRLLQQLRSRGLADIRGRQLRVPDWSALSTAAERETPRRLHELDAHPGA